jgi:hypothetical protein
MRCARRLPLPCALLLAGTLLAACDEGAGVRRAGETPDAMGPPRTFAMGISSLPPELTQDSYAGTFELASEAGEVILIQRTPPWQEMLSGDVSQETAQATQREKQLAQEHGLDIFVALDPTDTTVGRSELAGLPPALRGAGFADPDVRRAFIAYAQYVAQNYQPKYVALGVELNSYQSHEPEDFEAFLTLYAEAYDAVKRIRPDALVFHIFQLEEMHGLLPIDEPHPPQWGLIAGFGERLDLLAVSSYPSLAFNSPASIPETYYSRLAAYARQPIALTGMGFSSGSDDASEGGEAEQAAFLTRALRAADQLGMPLVVWFAGQDPSFTGAPPFDRLEHIGLRRQDGSAKEAWFVWDAAARRPLEEAAQTAGP